MTDRISSKQFQDSAGVDDWRVVFGGACAHFRVESFAAGLQLVEAIGGLAETANHHPDVDLRYRGVTVRLRSHDLGGLSERDVALARQISAAAQRVGATPDPSAVQTIQIALDALVPANVMPFWRALLGYEEIGAEDLVDPQGRAPSIWFQRMDVARPQRNRIHVDVSLPHDQARPRIAAALAAGGRLVSDANAPEWWTLADAEGNEADVATWEGREQ